MCVSSCVGHVVETGRGSGCAGEMHGAIAARNVEMSGCGKWGVQSMKMPSLGDSTCARIGSKAEVGPAQRLSAQIN